MSAVQQFDELLELAQQIGYRVRFDYFGGTGGGVCEFGGNRWLFIDLALSATERLEQLQAALAADPLMATLDLPAETKTELGLERRAA